MKSCKDKSRTNVHDFSFIFLQSEFSGSNKYYIKDSTFFWLRPEKDCTEFAMHTIFLLIFF